MFDIEDTPEKVIQGILRIARPQGKKRPAQKGHGPKVGRDIPGPLRVDPKHYNDEIPDPEVGEPE